MIHNQHQPFSHFTRTVVRRRNYKRNRFVDLSIWFQFVYGFGTNLPLTAQLKQQTHGKALIYKLRARREYDTVITNFDFLNLPALLQASISVLLILREAFRLCCHQHLDRTALNQQKRTHNRSFKLRECITKLFSLANGNTVEEPAIWIVSRAQS